MSDLYEIDSRLVVLCKHLLKWQFQPNRRSSSWRTAIVGAKWDSTGDPQQSLTAELSR